MDEYESLNSYQVGVQIPPGVHSEMPSQELVRGMAKAPWGSVWAPGRAERELDRRRSSEERPCA